MINLAQYFDGIEPYLRAFRLSAAEQADIRKSLHQNGTQVAVSEILQFWKKHNPSTATLGALLEILLQMRQEEVALNLCKYYFPRHKPN